MLTQCKIGLPERRQPKKGPLYWPVAVEIHGQGVVFLLESLPPRKRRQFLSGLRVA
jgi:hypothetical protein